MKIEDFEKNIVEFAVHNVARELRMISIFRMQRFS